MTRMPRRGSPLPPKSDREARQAYDCPRGQKRVPSPPFTSTPLNAQFADFQRRRATEKAVTELTMRGAYRADAPRSATGQHWCYKNALNVLVILGGTAEVALAALRRLEGKT